MTILFKKLNYKDQKEICILHSPTEFIGELQEMKNFADIITD